MSQTVINVLIVSGAFLILIILLAMGTISKIKALLDNHIRLQKQQVRLQKKQIEIQETTIDIFKKSQEYIAERLFDIELNTNSNKSSRKKEDIDPILINTTTSPITQKKTIEKSTIFDENPV